MHIKFWNNFVRLHITILSLYIQASYWKLPGSQMVLIALDVIREWMMHSHGPHRSNVSQRFWLRLKKLDTTALDLPSHFWKLGGARAKPTGQTPCVGKAQSTSEVIPGVGGPAYEQPCPTTAPWSIKIAYEPFILRAALGVAKCSTVRLLSIVT